MKMYGYRRVRGSRSADFEEPKWKDCSPIDLNSMKNRSAKEEGFSRIREQRKHGYVNPQQDLSVDPSAQAGFILDRALSLKESLKDKKLIKKISQPVRDSNSSSSSNGGGTNSLQGAVKRVFSMRKAGPDHDRQNPHSDLLSGEVGFKRSESMKYSRIASPPGSVDLYGDGSTVKKKKKSVLKTCKRLLGMQRN